MKIGYIIKSFDKECEFKVVKKLNNGFYKVKVTKGNKWYPVGKVYTTNEGCSYLLDKIKSC